MIAYKLVRKLKDGNLYPLFIDKRNPLKFDEWLEAKCYPTKGFAVRKGYHCTFTPYAPHLSMKLASGEERVWVECEVDNWTTYDRPESQGGEWILSQKIKFLRILSLEEVDDLLANVA